jgi:hypothetical protein
VAEALRKFLKLEWMKAEAELAAKLGSDQKTISNIERRQHRVTLIEIIELWRGAGLRSIGRCSAHCESARLGARKDPCKLAAR